MDIHSEALDVSSATTIGHRDHQEDRFLIAGHPHSPEGMLLAVFDGHGRDEVAQFAYENLRVVFLQQEGPPAEKIGRALCVLSDMTKHMQAGSTISAVHVLQNMAHVAFMGDSPIVIINRKGDLVVSEVHNVWVNAEEAAEAIKRGGSQRGVYLYAQKGGRGLQLTRSLGDADMGAVLNRTPQTYSVELGAESAILVCSDGVLDLSHDNHSETIMQQMVREIQKGGNAESILVMARPWSDNATAIVYRHQ